MYGLTIRVTETMVYSCQKQVLLQWLAVTVNERAPTINPFLTKSAKAVDRHVQRIRYKHSRRSYLAVGVSDDSHNRLELELIRPKDRDLLSFRDTERTSYLIRLLALDVYIMIIVTNDITLSHDYSLQQ